jgi:hypothetical protein
MAANNGNLVAQTDFNLHGLVGIRLLNATARDINAVARQLGPIQGPLAGDPDITIRFVDQLQLSSPIRYLGLDDAAFTDDAFLVLRSKHKARAKVQIPFERIGQRCEIVCERGLPAVPLLIPILNLTALNKGALPLHAAAFSYQGTGVLTTGWSKGGKTETLLAFVANGAQYIGDEWVYITPDGKKMHGIPEPIRVWHWHLQSLPQYWSLVGQGDRARLHTLKFVAQTMDRAANGASNGSAPLNLMRRVAPMVKQQMYVDVPPQKIFNRELGQMSGNLDKIFFVGSHELSDVTVQPITPEEVASRMVFSLQEERQDLLSFYYKFRFAFPNACNELLEQAEERQREILMRVMAHKATYAVYHPYPFSLPLLYDAMRPFVVKR